MRWLRKALIAPCVVTLAACGAASSSRGSVVSSAGLRLAGIHWVLTQVSHNGKPPMVIPSSTDANIEFRRDGTAVANDGVNGLDADYTATTTVIALHNAMFGAVGYGGGDPVLDATTRSFGDLFDRGDASYTITARMLTIDTPSWTLTFANAGPLRSPTGAPAPTRS